MSVTITRDEWLSEIQRVMRERPAGDPGMSTWEWADALNVGQARASIVIRQMCRRGQLITGWKPDVSRDGRQVRVPCYRPAPVLLAQRNDSRYVRQAKAAKKR